MRDQSARDRLPRSACEAAKASRCHDGTGGQGTGMATGGQRPSTEHPLRSAGSQFVGAICAPSAPFLEGSDTPAGSDRQGCGGLPDLGSDASLAQHAPAARVAGSAHPCCPTDSPAHTVRLLLYRTLVGRRRAQRRAADTSCAAARPSSSRYGAQASPNDTAVTCTQRRIGGVLGRAGLQPRCAEAP